MKKIFKFSLLALFVGIVSCDDAIDIVQANELSEENAYQTVADLQTGLNGVYAAYVPDAGSNGSGEVILFNDLFTDNIKRGISSSGQGNQVYNFILQPGSQFPGTLWSNRYALINYSNRLLKAWDRIFPTLESDSDIETANQIKAQALALRAIGHFELLQYFTPNYEDPSSPSVILLDFVPEVTDVFPRNTAGEAFEFIKNDLNEAASLVGDFYAKGIVSPYNAYYINGDVIKALQARVALFEGDYTSAGTYVDAIDGNYALSDTETGTYQSMYIDDNTTEENIWTLARKDGDNGVVALYYANGAQVDGSPFFEASYGLYDSYEANDLRTSIVFNSEDGETTSPGNILLIGKYPGGPFGVQVNDIKWIRWAEMLLIRAEVQARAGMLTEAAETIETLRDSRYQGNAPSVSYGSTDAALIDILLERRRELCFEGHRYLDLKRLGADVGQGIDRDERDCASFSAPCNLPSGDYRFTLPIPTIEINANPGIEQNPNYN